MHPPHKFQSPELTLRHRMFVQELDKISTAEKEYGHQIAAANVFESKIQRERALTLKRKAASKMTRKVCGPWPFWPDRFPANSLL